MSKVPNLQQLKTEPCTTEELQAALVKLIEHHNALVASIRDMQKTGRILSPHDAIMNMRFGL